MMKIQPTLPWWSSLGLDGQALGLDGQVFVNNTGVNDTPVCMLVATCHEMWACICMMRQLVLAFILEWLDYCNSVLYWLVWLPVASMPTEHGCTIYLAPVTMLHIGTSSICAGCTSMTLSPVRFDDGNHDLLPDLTWSRPETWNRLSQALWLAIIVSQFEHKLQSPTFWAAFQSWLTAVVVGVRISDFVTHTLFYLSCTFYLSVTCNAWSVQTVD